MYLYGSHRERTRVPVCWIPREHAFLPSFGSFTGGAEIDPAADDRLYAFATNPVWALPQLT